MHSRPFYHANGLVQQCVRVAKPHDSTQSRQSHFVVVVHPSHSAHERSHLNLDSLDSRGRNCVCRSCGGECRASKSKAVGKPPSCTGRQCWPRFHSTRSSSSSKPAEGRHSGKHDESRRRVNGQACICIKVNTSCSHKSTSTCYAGIYHRVFELDARLCHFLENE
jgi:hypothetical protein